MGTGSATSTARSRRGRIPGAELTLLGGLILLAGTLAAPARATDDLPAGPGGMKWTDDRLLILNPDLPVALDADLVDHLDIFPEIVGLDRVSFWRAPWGGVVARLEIVTEAGPSLRVRILAPEQWQEIVDLAARHVAGEPHGAPEVAVAPGGPGDPAAPLRAWPEVPLLLPPGLESRPPRRPAGFPALAENWVAVLEVGARTPASDFREFFTPMGQIGLAFGYAPLDQLAVLLSFSAGFGDMRGDFENSFGDGRTNSFGFSLGPVLRQKIGPRLSLYLQAEGGYYVRSLYWGGAFIDPVTGEVTNGIVLEQQDWGTNLRLGIMIQRRHKKNPRFVDIGIGWQSTPAERWDFWDESARFTADRRDEWIALTVRFWDAF